MFYYTNWSKWLPSAKAKNFDTLGGMNIFQIALILFSTLTVLIGLNYQDGIRVLKNQVLTTELSSLYAPSYLMDLAKYQDGTKVFDGFLSRPSDPIPLSQKTELAGYLQDKQKHMPTLLGLDLTLINSASEEDFSAGLNLQHQLWVHLFKGQKSSLWPAIPLEPKDALPYYEQLQKVRQRLRRVSPAISLLLESFPLTKELPAFFLSANLNEFKPHLGLWQYTEHLPWPKNFYQHLLEEEKLVKLKKILEEEYPLSRKDPTLLGCLLFSRVSDCLVLAPGPEAPLNQYPRALLGYIGRTLWLKQHPQGAILFLEILAEKQNLFYPIRDQWPADQNLKQDLRAQQEKNIGQGCEWGDGKLCLILGFMSPQDVAMGLWQKGCKFGNKESCTLVTTLKSASAPSP